MEYVIELATRFHDGRLNAKELWGMTEEEVMKELCAIRGIGVWTVHMFLIFSMKVSPFMAIVDWTSSKETYCIGNIAEGRYNAVG